MFYEKNNDPKLRGRYNYKNLKRWPKNVPRKDIFNLRKILIPINLNNEHWTLAVILWKRRKFNTMICLDVPTGQSWKGYWSM
jgi:Ulp1 family protease